MSLLRRLELLETHHPSLYTPLPTTSSALFLADSLALPPLIDDLRYDFFSFPPQPYPLDIVDAVADLVHVETSPVPVRGSCYRRVRHQRTTIADACADPLFLSLLDRVSSLEHKLEKALGERAKEREREYKWTAEIEGKHADRKYEWVAEIKPGKEKKGGKSFKWVTEVKEKGEDGERKYTWTESYGGIDDKKHKKDKEKDKKKEKGHDSGTRLVEIEDPADHRSLVLRQVCIRLFVSRVEERHHMLVVDGGLKLIYVGLLVDCVVV